MIESLKLIYSIYPEANFKFSYIKFKNPQNHRDELREALIQHLQSFYKLNLNPSEITQLKNLTSLPQHDKVNISLAHTKTHGAIATTVDCFLVGCDLETKKRVKAKLIKRILFKNEAEGPTPADTWVIKEACFKALSPLIPIKTIAEIRLAHWQRIDHYVNRCKKIYVQHTEINDFIATTEAIEQFKLGIVIKKV